MCDLLGNFLHYFLQCECLKVIIHKSNYIPDFKRNSQTTNFSVISCCPGRLESIQLLNAKLKGSPRLEQENNPSVYWKNALENFSADRFSCGFNRKLLYRETLSGLASYLTGWDAQCPFKPGP